MRRKGPRRILKGKKDCHMRQIRTVSIGEVQAFLQNHPGGFLIDVLPPEFHAQQHIPGSSGVCVFETAFQEKMRALVPDMGRRRSWYTAREALWIVPLPLKNCSAKAIRISACLPEGLRLGGKPGFRLRAPGWISPCRMSPLCRCLRSTR